MKRTDWVGRSSFLLILLAVVSCPSSTNAQSATNQEDNSQRNGQNAADVLKKIDQLVEQNRQLEEQNRELMEQIESLRKGLTTQAGVTPEATRKETVTATISDDDTTEALEGDGPVIAVVAGQAEQKEWGTYTPNQGFKLANTEYGDLSLSIYTYVRYLNQLGLDPTYTDVFGNVKNVQQRQDFQIQKLQMKFLGWVLDPKLRYLLYAWTSNASQGLGAQVVLAGNVNYNFNKYFNFAGGITSLPGTRSVEGNFPFALGGSGPVFHSNLELAF
jgi:hypothetical protein